MFVIMIAIILTNNYQSEFKYLDIKLNKIQIISYFFIIIFGYLLIKKIFLKSLNYRFIPNEIKYVSISTKTWDFFFLIILISQYIFFVKTGVGKLFSDKKSAYSFIFNLFSLKQFFIYYYFLCYRKSKLFYINIFGLVILEILKGWTGIIQQIFLFEMYFYLKKGKFKKIIFYYPVVLLVGSKVYQYLYILKYKIRLGINIKINYLEAIIKLIERLTYFPHALVGIQNQEKIQKLYELYNVNFIEIKGFFRPIIPSFVMKNKDFRGINNLLMKSVYPDLGNNTSSNMGFFSCVYNLIKFGIIEYGSYLIGLILIIILIKFLSDLLGRNTQKKEADIIFYYYLFKMYTIGDLENSFYAYITVVFLFVILIFFRGIKVKRVNRIEKNIIHR